MEAHFATRCVANLSIKGDTCGGGLCQTLPIRDALHRELSWTHYRLQNQLSEAHITKIIDTYQQRPERIERYARRVEMAEIEKNDFNLNISRYISTAVGEAEIDLQGINTELVTLAQNIKDARDKHNAFLKELGLPALP